MLIEKDLDKIKLLGERNERQNFKFRLFLKNLNMESKKIDIIVHEIYGEVVNEIDCTQCANCCRQIKPLLDEKDIDIFIKTLSIDAKTFKSNYLQEVKEHAEKLTFEFKELPCPFLQNNKCRNYQNRPKDCRSYPYLNKKNFTTRLLSIIDNYSICPIVFNVFELLKNNFRKI